MAHLCLNVYTRVELYMAEPVLHFDYLQLYRLFKKTAVQLDQTPQKTHKRIYTGLFKEKRRDQPGQGFFVTTRPCLPSPFLFLGVQPVLYFDHFTIRPF